MLSSLKLGLLVATGIGGTAALCGLCGTSTASAAADVPVVIEQGVDTAVTRLHISGMTCGTCPTTARLALKRLPGVYSATVTLEDSLGVVRYDAHQLTPDQIAAHLVRLTGYRTTVLSRPSMVPAKRTGA